MSAHADFSEEYFFEESLALRRSQIYSRLTMAGLVGLAYGLVIGWANVALWYAVYVAIQITDVVILRVRRSRAPTRRQNLTLAACAMIFLSNAVFITLALPAVFLFGPWGTFAYAFLICGITQHAVTGARASKIVFLCVAAACGPAFVALPFLVVHAGAPSTYILITALSSTIGLIGFGQMWRTNSVLHRSQVLLRLQAERADEAKSRFIATVSHDLRTPLTAIQAGATRLAASPGADGEDAALIKDASVMMRALLDDLLDVFKAEAGQMAVESIAIDPAAMLRSVARFWTSEAEARGLGMMLDGEGDLPPWIEGDPTRLRQILNNLISNAMKFTQRGQIRLTVSFDSVEFRVAVTDSGEGMDAETLGRLFTPYVQASSETARKHGGTGLGLAISRDLARLMGGELTVESQKDQGSTFTLRLPLRVCAPGVMAEPGVIRRPAPTDRPLSILVVDDHVINRRAMMAILTAIDAVAETAGSGQEALARLGETPFDVVLMDVNMPDLDGWETTRRLRSMEGPNRGTPVIAVTGATRDKDVAACLAAGMTAWVAKPVEPCDLFAAIDRVMSDPTIDTRKGNARPVPEVA